MSPAQATKLRLTWSTTSGAASVSQQKHGVSCTMQHGPEFYATIIHLRTWIRAPGVDEPTRHGKAYSAQQSRRCIRTHLVPSRVQVHKEELVMLCRICCGLRLCEQHLSAVAERNATLYEGPGPCSAAALVQV